MKTFRLIFLFCLAVTLINGCSPDDTPNPPEKQEKTSDDTDGTDTGGDTPDMTNTGGDPDNPDGSQSSTESDALIENVVIPGSVKKEGAPPTPNEGISLDVSQAGSIAHRNEGFELPFTSDGDVTGAFIQLKAEDAGVAMSYFDVDLFDNSEAPDANGKSFEKSSSHLKKASLSLKKPSDSSFDIGFTPQMATGEFCYIICVYDNAGNISAPQEVCLTINEWGGSAELIGTWNFLRYEEFYNGIVETEEQGVEDCDEPIGDDTGTRCYLIDYWRLTFDADGTYLGEFKEFNRDTADEPNFEDYDIEILRGNWSYNASDGSLLFVTYSYEYQENGESLEVEQYPIGEGDVVPVSRIELNGSQLALIFVEIDENGDGTIDDSYIEYYEKQ